MPFGVLGVAEADTDDCKPIPSAIVFIFAENFLSGSVQTNCETAAQEITHALVPTAVKRNWIGVCSPGRVWPAAS